MMRPLRIEWTLGTPMVAGAHPLHLDALVAYAVTEEALRSGRHASGSIRDLATELPLDKEVRDGEWAWKASALSVAAGGSHSMRFWTRKTDAMDYAERVAGGGIEGKFRFPLKPYAYKIDTQRGIFKQLFKFFPVRQVDKVVAWCIGDLDRLEEILAPEAGYITHLGSKTRMGFGRITSFSIQVDEAAHANWERRVLPWPHEGAVAMRISAHPPYWAQDNQREAFASPDLFA